MTDTPPEVADLQRRLLMKRSGEERLRMAASMGRTARALVLASLPEGLSEVERRVALFLRLYGSDFDKPQRDAIVTALRAGTSTE